MQVTKEGLRTLAECVKEEARKVELARVEEAMKTAAMQGKFSVLINTLSEDMRSYLKTQGFEVKNSQQGYNEYCWQISW